MKRNALKPECETFRYKDKHGNSYVPCNWAGETFINGRWLCWAHTQAARHGTRKLQFREVPGNERYNGNTQDP